MLRIPLPEVARATPIDGFALALPEDNQALQMRPWRSHREQGRQNTDGGERSVTPGQTPLPPPAPPSRREGGGVINLP